jgi:precorrin-3B synthase
MRRGACPTLGEPMPTGDGLLVRFRPVHGRLSAEAARAVAAAAARCGNGRIEITSRGKLQLRGIRKEALAELESAILSALDIETGIPVETPPLAGLDPSEIADPRPLADALRHRIGAAGLSAKVSPKTCVIVDGGGTLQPDHLDADVRLEAGPEGWSVRFGGAILARGLLPEDAVREAFDCLARLGEAGKHARARDLVPGGRAGAVPEPPRIVGPHRLADGSSAHGLALGMGGIDAGRLAGFLAEAGTIGVEGFRLAFGHGLLAMGLDGAAAGALSRIAAGHGLIADPDDPLLALAACPGIGRCASALLDTQSMGRDIAAAASALLDGSVSVHLSGCVKGCAQPRAAALVFSGVSDGGCRLVVNGRAGDRGVATIDPGRVGPGLARLGRLYRAGRHAQESAAQWLDRIAPAEIAAAFA